MLAGRSSWAVVSAAPPPTGLMRTHHTPGGYQPHAKDLFFYFVSYTTGRSFDLFQRAVGAVGGLLGLLGGC